MRLLKKIAVMILTIFIFSNTAYAQVKIPQENVYQFLGGSDHIVIRDVYGDYYTSGTNSHKQLEISSYITDKLQKITSGPICMDSFFIYDDKTVKGTGFKGSGAINVTEWTDIENVYPGLYHTVGLKGDGKLVSTVITSSYSNCDYGQTAVSSFENVRQAACGIFHTAILFENGSVKQIGGKPATSVSYPGTAQVNTWTDIIQISAGRYFTAGLKSDGTVVAAGDNSYGQCNVSDWTDVVKIACGGNHILGLKADGTVVAAGYNQIDVNGDITVIGQCNVSDWTDVVDIYAGETYSAGIRKDGIVLYAGREGIYNAVKNNTLFESEITVHRLNNVSEMVQIGSNVYMKYIFYNYTGYEQNASIMTAFYNSSGRLLEIKINKNIISAGSELEINSGLNNIPVGTKKVKWMLIDGTNNIKPLIADYEITLK